MCIRDRYESLNTENPTGIHPIFINPKKFIEAVPPSILSVPEFKVKSPAVVAVRLVGPFRVTVGDVRVYDVAHVMSRLPIVSVTAPAATTVTPAAYVAISSLITLLTLAAIKVASVTDSVSWVAVFHLVTVSNV